MIRGMYSSALKERNVDLKKDFIQVLQQSSMKQIVFFSESKQRKTNYSCHISFKISVCAENVSTFERE